jgi:arabinan endo-1,5-alpha-L-arabinosidase
MWGPDITHWKGKYHLYYCVSKFGQQLACIGLATNRTLDRESPEYRWEDQGMIIKSEPGKSDFCAIDGTMFLKGGREPWMVFGSSHFLKLVKLGANGTIDSGSRLVSVAQRTGPIIEAPYLFEHDGWFYLFISCDQCCQGVNSTYHIRVGRSRNIEGPFVDFAGRPMLDGHATLVLAGYGTIRGPGNNVVFKVKGREYLVHHFYDALDNGTYTLQFRPLLWGADGWPLAGEPGILEDGPAPKEQNAAGRWAHSVDFRNETEITLLAGGKINQKSSRATWSRKGANLEFRWASQAATRGASFDQCILAPDGQWYVGRNEQGAVIRGRRIE